MSNDMLYVDRQTRSVLNQVTSLYLVWCSCTDQSASRHNYWQKCEKNAYSLIFVPKYSITASYGLVISCY